MFSQSPSPSSSPDILGPPGDVEYLISSPVRPFSGRQSFMSPANFKLLQDPRTGKKTRPRINFSPTKSAHSIQFSDVLLPASPSKKLNIQHRSVSPEKTLEDGNTSPWRIRVTLEATQDEEMNEGSPSRKRPRPSTSRTTKIPLKDVEDHVGQTPRRRRGRPRKSDIHEDATPTAGGPGNTPGPGGTSGQKRKRGRPRKQPVDGILVDSGEPAVDRVDDNMMNLVDPEPEPESRWSPLNLAGEADSDDDALPEDFMAVDNFENADNQEHPTASAWDRNTPRVTHERTYETPDVTLIDQIYENRQEGEPQSTPSKMPSPSRESQIFSPDNTLHAGHTPRPSRPPRSYPSPTSSSLGDDDRPAQFETEVPLTEAGLDYDAHGITNDPTDEHREFDSIIESEGFSMVSLDTLPSVKQHGLSINSQTAQSALKPFLQREKIAFGQKSKRKVSTLNLRSKQVLSDPAMEAGPGSIDKGMAHSPVRSTDPETRPSSRGGTKFIEQDQPTSTVSSVPQFSTHAARTRNPIVRLVRIIRAAIVLEGALRRPYEGAPVPTPGTPDLREQISSLEGPRRRLELLFSEFNPRIRRELHAGLALAQELAKRRRNAEIEQARRAMSVEASLKGKRGTAFTETPQQETHEAPVKDIPSTEMKRRLEEWQREREAISREIQMASTSQVIVLDSDATGPPSPELDDDDYELRSALNKKADTLEERPEARIENDVQTMYNDQDEEEDYDDIWQQEARDHSNLSHHSSTFQKDPDIPEIQGEQRSSPLKSSPRLAAGERGTFSPVPWTHTNEKVPFLGHSRVKRLREQAVDLSTVLRGEETPHHIRRYYGHSSPARSVNEQSPEQRQSSPEYLQAASEGHDFEDEQVSDIYLESSPNKFSDDDTFQIDPTTRHESERQRADQTEDQSEDGNMLATALADDVSVHEGNSLTPAQTRTVDGAVQASSWFQKISSLTPGWLKAPKETMIAPPHGSASENVSEREEEEEVPDVRSSKDVGAYLDDQERLGGLDETPRQLQSIEEDNDEPISPTSDVARPLEDRPASPEEKSEQAAAEPYEPHFPLSVSGYFSDEHYTLLRRLYRLSKRHPERFPYYSAPGRSDIIGDWIWTSNGRHGVRVTETQFAIIDRFVQELARGDLQAGGTGQIGWTEADMHRRLISIIIGEQIREEMGTGEA